MIIILAISLVFLIKQTDGPFGIIGYLRGYFLRSYIGPEIYKLINCYYCLGFHAGYIAYFIGTNTNEYCIRNAIIYAFLSAIVNYYFYNLVEKCDI